MQNRVQWTRTQNTENMQNKLKQCERFGKKNWLIETNVVFKRVLIEFV